MIELVPLDPEPKKTVTMTFRIEEAVLDQLRSESEKKEVSLNTFVNQVLKRFVEWDMYESKVGMIPIARPIVYTLFEKMDEGEVIEMAKKVGKGAVHDIALFMKRQMDIGSFLSWLETRLKNSSVEFSHSVKNGRHTYVIKHDLGRNWSLYHKTLLEQIFSEVLGRRADIAITSTTMSFAVDE
jgi:hypothetical protein